MFTLTGLPTGGLAGHNMPWAACTVVQIPVMLLLCSPILAYLMEG